MVKTKRDLSYEVIRVLAMVLIVLTHEIGPYLGDNPTLSSFTEVITVVGVTLFFLLSGKFAFKLNLEDKSLYKKFYWKKFIGLIVPMLIFMLIKEAHVLVYNKGLELHPKFFAHQFLLALFNGFNYMEYWFLYILIANFLAVPFTARMVQNFKDRDKKAFLTVGLILGTITTFLPHILGVNFEISYYFIGYTLLFYSGYFIEDLFKTEKSKKKLYLVGLFSLIITLVLVQLKITNGYKSTSPFYFFYSVALFIGVRELSKKFFEKKPRELLEKVVLFIGKHSLAVYMLHMIVLYFINDLITFPKNFFGWILSSCLVIIASLAVSWILDVTIVKWVQKLFIRVFKLEKVLK